MGEAFENVLNELRLEDRTDPLCEMIAKTIIDLGKQGVRNPTQIFILTMKALKD